MVTAVKKLTDQVQALAEEDFDDFLDWLARYETEQEAAWDRQIERDSRPGGGLEGLLTRARKDIAQGRTKPLDEVLDNS
jgi:plasmid stabilization system protein ParE